MDKWQKDDSEQANLRLSIKSAVNEMFDKHNEVPFLAMYRKQVVIPSPRYILPSHAHHNLQQGLLSCPLECLTFWGTESFVPYWLRPHWM